MTLNNVFSSVDCWWLWKETIVHSSVLALKSAGFSYSRCSKWCPFAFMDAHNCFSPLTNSFDILLYASPKCHWCAAASSCWCWGHVSCTMFLHIRASVTKFCSRPGFRVNRTVWQTQIWTDRIRWYLLPLLLLLVCVRYCSSGCSLSLAWLIHH